MASELEKIEIKLLDISSLRQQVEMYLSAFESANTYEETLEYWRRKHYENPVHTSYIFGVYDKDKLVSMNAYMPMHYFFNGKKCNVIQSCESGTIPEYRGKGLWSRVVKFAVQFFIENGQYDFLIGFPNYENSYTGFMKMNWNHDADVINYIYVVNGKEFIKSILRIKNFPFARALEFQKIAISINKNTKLHISDYEVFDIYSEDGFNLAVESSLISWKEAYKDMHYFNVADNYDNIIAVCMYFAGKYNGSEIIYFCTPRVSKTCKDIKGVYAFCLREILKRNPQVAFIRAWAIDNSIAQEAYSSLLFLKSKHHNPFITYQLKEDVISSQNLHYANNWNSISFLDLD